MTKVFDLATLNGNNGFQLILDVYGAFRTTTAGDFNGDGFDDLLVNGITLSTTFGASIFLVEELASIAQKV